MTDPDSFADFVRASTTSLFATAYLLTGNKGAAEELVQDTLVRLYPKWDKVEDADNSLAYVRRSLINVFVTATRLPAHRDLPVWQLPDRWDGRDVSDIVVNRRLSWQLLGTLPHRQRAAVVLRYFHDLTDQEIAESLGCRVGTVRSLISRALAALRVSTRTSTTPGSQEAV